jgi:hypothetical protein
MRVDHDVSLLIPEIWSRMSEEERDPRNLIRGGYLEKCPDFDCNGKTVLASRLGYRITLQFVIHFFGRVFNHPHVVFTNEMLRPELQDAAVFADGMDNIVSTQQRVAQSYFNDQTIQFACPPLKALLHIMAWGEYEGKDLHHPEIRNLFTRESLLSSDWYGERLIAKQRVDRQFWEKRVAYLGSFIANSPHHDEHYLLAIEDRFAHAQARLAQVNSGGFPETLRGTLGAEPALWGAPNEH